MARIYYENDFKIIEKFQSEDLVNVPFTFTYYTNTKYEVSWDGKKGFKNCRKNDDGSFTYVFNSHGLGVGKLKVRREFYIPDGDFIDGSRTDVSIEDTGIILVNGAGDDLVVDTEIIPPYIYIQEVVDSLEDTSTAKALSANQGMVLNGKIGNAVTSLNRVLATLGDHNNIRVSSDNIIDLDDMVAVSGIYRITGEKQYVWSFPPIEGTNIDATIINKVIKSSSGVNVIAQFVVLSSDNVSDDKLWYRINDKDTQGFGDWVSIDAFHPRIAETEHDITIINKNFKTCQTQVDELYSFLTKLKTAFGTEDLDVIVNKVAEVANAEGDVFITM